MIAKVRIAPVERWCEPSKTLGLQRGAPEVGMEVEILTETLHKGRAACEEDCDGRFWDLTKESAQHLRLKAGLSEAEPFITSTLCEHMLDMD